MQELERLFFLTQIEMVKFAAETGTDRIEFTQKLAEITETDKEAAIKPYYGNSCRSYKKYDLGN